MSFGDHNSTERDCFILATSPRIKKMFIYIEVLKVELI
jgi:hypothetical protein